MPLTQSHEILRRVRGAAERGGSVWWRATYWTLRALMANGNYDEAVVLLNGLDRTFTNFDDNKYGLAELFKDAKRELTAKGVMR